jgi:hypothetical protein
VPPLKDRLTRSLKRIFHRPTVQIGKANIMLYASIILIFILALILRLLPMIRYVSELRALDPYAQLRATEFIIQNGLVEFFKYHDYMSWYPNGINLGSYLLFLSIFRI